MGVLVETDFALENLALYRTLTTSRRGWDTGHHHLMCGWENAKVSKNRRLYPSGHTWTMGGIGAKGKLGWSRSGPIETRSSGMLPRDTRGWFRRSPSISRVTGSQKPAAVRIWKVGKGHYAMDKFQGGFEYTKDDQCCLVANWNMQLQKFNQAISLLQISYQNGLI